ncbi:MAG: octanoyltransferase [Rhodomicrobium sp.]|nr:MAG: octanoyltransferase [Rhodomicrobium sp.]
MVNILPEMADVEWKSSDELVPYPEAIDFMEARVADIAAGRASECIWLLEHPPLYTAGTSAKEDDLLTSERFPVYKTGRGGEYTYHGPGQRIAYIMLDLNKRRRDVRWFVGEIEGWVIETCAKLGVTAERREGRVGLWVQRPEKGMAFDGRPLEDKIAAIGIRMRRWVSFHGVSINVSPQLEHFSGIVPCGITEHGVTSFQDLGLTHNLSDVDAALKAGFYNYFND